MSYQEFKDNWQIFSDLIEKLPLDADTKVAEMIKHYIEQNITILNDVLDTSICHLRKLENAASINDIVSMQLNFTNEINHKLTLTAQRFLNTSLGSIADYNDWLKSHCDLATD